MTDVSTNPDTLFAWMAALGDATRARILHLVQRSELSVSELCAVTQLPQSTVSRHLKVLVDEGWATSRRDGTSRFYRMANQGFGDEQHQLWSLLQRSLAQHPQTEADAERLTQVLRERSTKSQAFFQGSAGRWDKLRAELFGSDFELRLLPALLPPDSVVADLGCGTGRLLELLSPFAHRLDGVDSSSAMISTARTRLANLPNARLHAADVERLPLESGSYDVVLMILIMHYLADPQVALREASRILKPGGRAVIVDMHPHDHEEYRSQMGHQWLGFEQETIARWSVDAGFEVPAHIKLPPDSAARGPSLFIAVASKANHHSRRD